MNNGQFSGLTIVFFNEWSKKKLVFEVFNESLFVFNQTLDFSSSVFIDWNNVSIIFPDKNKFLSSAKMTVIKFEEALNKSLYELEITVGQE